MWLNENNREKHFIYAIIPGVISLFFALGLAIGLEYKEKENGKEMDWLNVTSTVLGGLLGAIIRWMIILAIWL